MPNHTEPDQFWSEDAPEDCHNDEQELAYAIADNLIAGEDATVKVWCSKRLPTRKLFVTVTEENDTREVVWHWVEEPEPEKPKTFQRENRYIVVKITDINPALNHSEARQFADLIYKIDAHRRKEGKDILQAVVVEHDWPEYEPVWQMIEERAAK